MIWFMLCSQRIGMMRRMVSGQLQLLQIQNIKDPGSLRYVKGNNGLLIIWLLLLLACLLLLLFQSFISVKVVVFYDLLEIMDRKLRMLTTRVNGRLQWLTILVQFPSNQRIILCFSIFSVFFILHCSIFLLSCIYLFLDLTQLVLN